jgi:hypothetical protein
MIGEINIAGVFVPALVLWGLVAMGLGAIVRQVLTSTGFYRLVWHRGLFDIALFFILWGLVVALVIRFGIPSWPFSWPDFAKGQ